MIEKVINKRYLMKINSTSPNLSLLRRGTRKIVAVVGPTASGKTAVGVKLAKYFNGEIVSADSRQVFRGLDIGTAKEGKPAQGGRLSVISCQLSVDFARSRLRYIDDIPQWMIDVADPEEQFNLFQYLKLARLAIQDILSRGKMPIIVGGTGLYIQALTEGYALEQNQKSKIKNQNCGRNEVAGLIDREQLNNLTIKQLQKILHEIDEKSFADLADKKNPHRLIRAIERAQEGMKMTKIKPDWEILQIGISWPRDILNQRIDKRVDERFREGMLQEVSGLIKSGVDENWFKKLGLEYREITNFLQHIAKLLNCSMVNLNNQTIKQYKNEFKQMSDLLKLRSHQYAKRQMTWFRRFPDIVWENKYSKIEDATKKFLK